MCTPYLCTCLARPALPLPGRRFNLTQSSSFAELDPHWRDGLARLHDDYYFRRQDALWRANAMKTLPVLMGATDMLVCGEDLGLVPDCVPPVMQVGQANVALHTLQASMHDLTGLAW